MDWSKLLAILLGNITIALWMASLIMKDREETDRLIREIRDKMDKKE